MNNSLKINFQQSKLFIEIKKNNYVLENFRENEMLRKEIENEISDENDMSEKPNIVSQLLCNLDAFLVQELVATLVPTKFFFY